jgi:hypothetical protein
MFAERLAQRRARIAIVLALSLIPSIGLGQQSARLEVSCAYQKHRTR